jgi:hypothetical protein
MKPVRRLVLFAAAFALGAPALAADVGVSINISQPGVYGRIDVGRFPQPQVVMAQPVVIYRPAVVQAPPPVYMWVPPGHRKNWRQHCGAYNACGVPVYFVRDDWYGRNVRPYQGRGEERREERRDDRRDEHHDNRGGRGHDRRD